VLRVNDLVTIACHYRRSARQLQTTLRLENVLQAHIQNIHETSDTGDAMTTRYPAAALTTAAVALLKGAGRRRRW